MKNDKFVPLSLRQFKVNARRIQSRNPGMKLTEAQEVEAKRMGYRDRNDAIRQLTEQDKLRPAALAPAAPEPRLAQLRQRIIDRIQEQAEDDEFYNEDYPDHAGAVRAFLDEEGIDLDGEGVALEEDVGAPYIDMDGYAGVNAAVRFPQLGLTVKVIAYHHRGWDFYFDGLALEG